jgi:hypothetical protein
VRPAQRKYLAHYYVINIPTCLRCAFLVAFLFSHCHFSISSCFDSLKMSARVDHGVMLHLLIGLRVTEMNDIPPGQAGRGGMHQKIAFMLESTILH